MTNDDKTSGGNEIRALRLARGLSQSDVAKALDISLKTIGRVEKEGRGHNLRRIRRFLESLAPPMPGSTADGSGIRAFIEEQTVPGRGPLGLAFHELAALLDALPPEHRGIAVQTFVDVQRQLEDASVDPLRTLEAAAQVTIKAFSRFVPR